jgi:hypothetical protein
MTMRRSMQSDGAIKSAVYDATRKIMIGCFNGLMVAGNRVKKTSQMLCPEDSGTLRRSCLGPTISTRGTKMIAEIAYTTYYAVYVHECNRNYHKPGSQWKFLETAMQLNSFNCRRDIIEGITRATMGSQGAAAGGAKGA